VFCSRTCYSKYQKIILTGRKRPKHSKIMRGANNPNYEKKWMKGRNNPNWKNGISKRPYSYKFSESLKELIRQRDGHKCQYCGVPQIECLRKLDIHHIDYNKKNCKKKNLVALCRSCNSTVNFNREVWKKYFRSLFTNKHNYSYAERRFEWKEKFV
jgi:hypothetical protein